MTLPQELIEEIKKDFHKKFDEMYLIKGDVWWEAQKNCEIHNFLIDCLNFAYQAGLKDRKEEV